LKWIEQEIRDLLKWKRKIGGYINDIKKDILAELDVFDFEISDLWDAVDGLKEDILKAAKAYVSDTIEELEDTLYDILFDLKDELKELKNFLDKFDDKVIKIIDAQKDKVLTWVSDSFEELIEKYLDSEVK